MPSALATQNILYCLQACAFLTFRRFAVRVVSYSPGRRLRGVRVPVLVQVAERDATTPPGPALKLGRLGPHVQVRTYDCGHFEPYVEPAFSGVVADQLEFLRGLGR